MKPKLLQTNDLSVGYHEKDDSRVVLSGLDISLEEGRLVVLIGPNGAGKSTLMRTLGGFQRPLSGTVRWNGVEGNKLTRLKLSQIVSVVLTNQVIVDKMTVADMVSMGRSPYTGFGGRLSRKDKSVVMESLRRCQVEELHDRWLTSVSDGERQKAMIARSLAQQTEVILLDEPTAFLDFPSRVMIFDLLRSIVRREKKAVLLTTHDIDLALQFADELWLVNRNAPLLKGVPEELALNGKLKDYFKGQHVNLDFDSGKFTLSLGLDAPMVSVSESIVGRYWMVNLLKRKGIGVTHHSKWVFVEENEGRIKLISENVVVKEWLTINHFFETFNENLLK